MTKTELLQPENREAFVEIISNYFNYLNKTTEFIITSAVKDRKFIDDYLNENIKEKSINFPFEAFWKLYPKKTGKHKCQLKWNKLSDQEREMIIKTLPSFIAYKPFEEYNHPMPLTYLNGKRWEDEIPVVKKESNNNMVY